MGLKNCKDVVPFSAAFRTAKNLKKNALNHDTDKMNDLILMKMTNGNFVKFFFYQFRSLSLTSVDLHYISACRFYKGIKHDTVYFEATGQKTRKNPQTDFNKKHSATTSLKIM